MMATDWGDVPTWVAGVGTLLAVAVALWLAGRDDRRWRQEVRRRQAELITAWFGGPDRPRNPDRPNDKPVTIANASPQLVYEMIVSLVAVQGAYRQDARKGGESGRIYVGQVPPGRYETFMRDVDYGMYKAYGLELAFQDAAGRYWRRLGDGRLEKLPVGSVEFYGLSRPIEWESG